MMAAAAAVALAATVVVLGALVALHLLPTGLTPISDPVSAYALTRFRVGYAVAAIAAAIAGAAIAVVLAGMPHSTTAVVLLWIFALARVAIPLFPMDRPGAAGSRSGRAHNLLAVVAFASVTAAGFVAASTLADAGYRALAAASTAAAVVMAVGSVAVILGSSLGGLRRLFGVFERLTYLGFIGWFLILSIGMLVG